MTKTEYGSYSAIVDLIVCDLINQLMAKELLTPDKIEPLKDELLTAIDWHCAPRTD